MTKNLNIVYTSDLHGFLLPKNYIDNSQTDGGLTKLIEGIRSFSRENTILIDLGDSLQGSPLMYFHQLNRSKFENPAAEIFNYIDYDYFVPGNHDFNYGKDYLEDFIDSISATTLCQNIKIKGEPAFGKGYDIKTMSSGIKVLIIGATTKYIPNWENPANIKGLEFTDAFLEVKQIVDTHKNDVDLIICAYHGGLERDLDTKINFVRDTGENQGFQMFEKIPEIDILLTGHQHRIIARRINNRVVIQPGGNAENLGVVEIEFDESNKISHLIPYLMKADKFNSDLMAEELINDIESANQVFLDEVIGEVVEGDLEIHDPFIARRDKHEIVGFINGIQMEATGAMLSSTSLANVVSGFKKQITIRNVLSTYIYSNTLVLVEINGKTLKEYLERCAEYFVIMDDEIVSNPRFSYPKVEHYNYDMIDGIDYVYDIKKPFGERLASCKYQDHEIKDTDTFTLALNNYRASGGGDFEMLKDLKVIREIPLDIAELMIEYVRIHRFLHVKPKNNIKLLK